MQTIQSAQVCIPNISTDERRKRLVAGGIQLLFTLLILAVLIAFGVSRWWRLALFPMFWASTIGFFQWRDHT